MKPKKLKISTRNPNGSLKEIGKMEWDGDKWFISGKCKDGIKSMIGERGKYFGGKIYTLKDRELCFPLMMGYCGFVADIMEWDKNDNVD